jgi:hypothetical protein
MRGSAGESAPRRSFLRVHPTARAIRRARPTRRNGGTRSPAAGSVLEFPELRLLKARPRHRITSNIGRCLPAEERQQVVVPRSVRTEHRPLVRRYAAMMNPGSHDQGMRRWSRLFPASVLVLSPPCHPCLGNRSPSVAQSLLLLVHTCASCPSVTQFLILLHQCVR